MTTGDDADVKIAGDEDTLSYLDCDLAAESVQAYKLGGYHPVLLGDTFKNDTYRILKKIGYGSFSTVWLARDMKYPKPLPQFHYHIA